ncbi:putative diguanylate cyclase YcdT [Poriferisphaera corsica]|uniref:diguanylate cyclase n=1 Tax=Poriferisphaera corsica TaxID=2528020 RepID=A0A517YRH7_9BACT|nr:diguanylate cyclase [Poriferisphaera corsica]QDU32829.1 putative diguanylate cyclase YcdT [Poriferisphaera corsica]
MNSRAIRFPKHRAATPNTMSSVEPRSNNEPAKPPRDLFDLFSRLISTSPDFISYIDRKITYQIINDRYVTATGLPKEQIIGKHVKDVIGSEIYFTHTEAALERCFNGNTTTYEGWFNYNAIGRRYVTTKLTPYFDKQNNIIGALIYSRDITDQKKAEDRSIESEAMFRQMFEGHKSPIILIDLQNGHVADANHQACSFFNTNYNQITSQHANHIAQPINSSRGLFDMLLSGQADHEQLIIKLNNKTQKEVLIQSTPIWVDADAHLCIIIRDITAEAEHKRELQSIFSNSMIGVGIMRPGRTIDKCNPRLAQMLGYDHPSDIEKHSTKILHYDYPETERFVHTYRTKLINGEPIHADLQLKRKDGSPVWCSFSANALDTNIPPDLDKGILWIVDDISPRKAIESMLQKIASKDGLTGIYSRSYFLEHSKKMIHQTQSDNTPLTLILLDIDHFKRVNDTHGHPTGDKTITSLTQCINKILRKSDAFGRMGGEEFAILLPNTSLDETRTISEQIRQAIQNTTIDNDNTSFNITISLGFAALTPELDTLDKLISAADKALYHAKQSGRNQSCSYHDFCLV